LAGSVIVAAVAVAMVVLATVVFVPYLRDITTALRDASGRIGEGLQDLSVPSTVSQAIEQAIANGDFELHYQPIVDLRGGNVTGVEALVRWRQARSSAAGSGPLGAEAAPMTSGM